ncbi:MAG: site-specific integrase [Bdellovibrio sp.]|nr:site-specific integrase [Bdellovibrio sp.]
MAVSSYTENNQVYWQAYVNLRSSINPKIRLQKRIKEIESEKAAKNEEKRLLADLSKQIARLELQGSNWEKVIEKWELDKLAYRMSDLVKTTILDYSALLQNWTKIWYGRPAQDLNRGDGRDVLKFAQEMGKSDVFVRRLKNTINLVYTWGIEEKLIVGPHVSPVYGIDLGTQKEQSVPEILTRNEVQTLIAKADEKNHHWAPIWKGALLTGMRSGELNGLQWSGIEMIAESDAKVQDTLAPERRRYGLIRVHRTWNTRTKSYGPTKGGYWRTIPISMELYWFLIDLKKKTGHTEFVFPRSWEWNKGYQASVLRTFCADLGLKSVKFHTLRACFATLLIQSGVSPTRVMKICGWQDLKTMQRYIRMAGIDEQGATEGLNLLPVRAQRPQEPSQEAINASEESANNQVMNQVVSLLDFKAAR